MRESLKPALNPIDLRSFRYHSAFTDTQLQLYTLNPKPLDAKSVYHCPAFVGTLFGCRENGQSQPHIFMKAGFGTQCSGF